jgi:beta-galactosidase
LISIQDEKIMINGEEVLLFGGELHYFRVPRQEWRTRIRQMRDAGVNMISTYVPWIFHEIEEGVIDLKGKTRPERDLQSFLEIVGEEGMHCLVRPGPYVMAEVVDHGVPTWFIEKYPEAVAKKQDGEIHPTRVVSYTHPVFLEKVENWYKDVCSVIAPFQVNNGGPVILFQLDNEVGMFHWVTNTPDYNETTLAEFETYLKNKYTPADFEFMFRIPFEQIHEFARSMTKKPEVICAHSLRNEYSLFLRNHYRRFIEHLKKSAEDKGIKVPFVVNIHGFHTVDLLKRGTMYPIGISQLLETAKIENVLMAGDYYIGNIEYDSYIDIVLANAFTRAIQWKEQPLFSAEFQGGSIHDKPRLQPTTFDLTTRLCVADGMNGVNYYMFVGGENYENIGLFGRRHEWQAPLSSDGGKRPHYFLIQHLGQMFKTFEKSLLNTKPKTDTCLGFYPDYYMTEFYDEYTREMITEIQHGREMYVYNGIAKGLRSNNIIFEAKNLLDNMINPEEIPVLWVYSTHWMDEDVQRKLISYLENGGTLILYPSIPVKTMKNIPCTLLRDYINVPIKGSKKDGFVQIGDIDNVSVGYMQTYEYTDGAFAWSEDEQRDIIAFEKLLGKGKLIMFGIGMDMDFSYKNDVIVNLAARAGVKTRFTLQDDIDITVRSNTDGSRFFFLHNFDEYKKETTITYKGETLFGGKKIVIPPRKGLMLPENVFLREDLKIVYGTGELYKVTEENDRLLLFLKGPHDEEEFVFHSSKWTPVETEDISVQIRANEKYSITISKRDETATLEFIRNT